MTESQAAADNVVVICGQVSKEPQARVSPGGIPMVRFLLDHESQQREAGLARQVRCRILVVASGAELQNVATGLVRGCTIRVTGFLSRGGYRDREPRIVLHAQRIDYLD